MEPVARRTRRQRDYALFKEYQARKKNKPSEEEKKQTGQPSSSRDVSSTRSPVSRKVKKQDNAAWSSSESEELVSESSGNEDSDYEEEKEDQEDEDAEMVEEGVEVNNTFDAFGTREHPIVLGADSNDEEKDDSVSSRSVKDLEAIENSAKCTPVKHNDDVAEEEEEENEEVEEGVNEEAATEIQQVLLNSIMENDIDEDAGENPLGSEESSENDSGGEDMEIKDPQLEEIEECYRLMDYCLEKSDHFGAETGLVDEESAKNQEKLCKEGHTLIHDEEKGTYCDLCPYIKEEIRDVMPPFHSNPFAISSKDDYYTYDNRSPNSHFEDSNIESQHFKDDAEIDTSGTVWELKQGLRGTLLAHQREAFEFIWKNVVGGTNLAELMNKRSSEGGGCLISHAPGTGKTRLTIAFLETYMKFASNSRPMVLAPASILLTWKQEFEKWKVEAPFLNLNEDESKDKRMTKLSHWKRHESVLAVSYSLFTKITNEDEELREALTETPGIVVLDEAHVARNERSLIFNSLKRVKTKRRILLSGTLFQNNFLELRNTLCLMREEFKDETEPFKKSGVDESDEGKIRDLKKKMKPFCHRCASDVLFSKLPGFVRYKVSLQPTEHQKRLLEFEEKQPKRSFQTNVNMTLISIHPMLLHCKESKTDFAEELKSGNWDISDGSKTRFLVTFIQLSSALQEKVLVFSQYLPPLNFVKAILQSNHFGWKEGVEIHLMDGTQPMEKRKRIMDEFNKPKGKAKVMLASTKACSEGIKFTGASRVVMLDVTWNPAVEEQAIARAYRMGQQRVVHVYHLMGTSNDSNRHLIQNQKHMLSEFMFPPNNKDDDDGPQYEDVILERLREEKIIHEFTLVKKRINHL